MELMNMTLHRYRGVKYIYDMDSGEYGIWNGIGIGVSPIFKNEEELLHYVDSLIEEMELA